MTQLLQPPPIPHSDRLLALAKDLSLRCSAFLREHGNNGTRFEMAMYSLAARGSTSMQAFVHAWRGGFCADAGSPLRTVLEIIIDMEWIRTSNEDHYAVAYGHTSGILHSGPAAAFATSLFRDGMA